MLRDRVDSKKGILWIDLILWLLLQSGHEYSIPFSFLKYKFEMSLGSQGPYFLKGLVFRVPSFLGLDFGEPWD